jgi:hypothetical protein
MQWIDITEHRRRRRSDRGRSARRGRDRCRWQPGETATEAGGAVDAPTIADATYSSGSAHIEVSGGKQLTLDAQLAVGMSMTGAGATLLMYPAEGSEGELFSISNSPETGLTFTLQAPGLVTGSDASTCPIELAQNDASGIAGRFECSGLEALLGVVGGSVNVKATFSARNERQPRCRTTLSPPPDRAATPAISALLVIVGAGSRSNSRDPAGIESRLRSPRPPMGRRRDAVRDHRPA